MTQAKFQKTVKWIVAGSAALLFVLVVVIFSQYISLAKLRREGAAYSSKLEQLYSQERALEESIENRKSVGFAERYAREQLGMIKEGEVIYEINR